MYLLIGVSIQNNVAIFMNKYELAKKINEQEGLTNDEKSELFQLLRSKKKYGLVWEDKPEDITQLYPEARNIKRHFILHIGETNTGKTQ